MKGKRISPPEGVAAGQDLYEVDFEVQIHLDPPGEHTFLLNALDAGRRDAAARRNASAVSYNSATTQREVDEYTRDIRYWRGIDHGYGVVGEYLTNRRGESVLLTFSSLALSVDALWVVADHSPFVVKRTLWQPSGLGVTSVPEAKRARSLGGQLLQLCDAEHRDRPEDFFDLTQLTPPGGAIANWEHRP